VLGALVLAAGCQHGTSTPFPPGLMPLEDNQVSDTDSTDEVLRTMSVHDPDVDHDVHGRGLVHVDPNTLWAVSQMPAAMVARCATDSQAITLGDDPMYVFSFVVHYVVNQILTVEWDDEWRYGVIADGSTPDMPFLGMVEHQKTNGSSFITLSEGTVEILATDDPATSELAFVEHLTAASGSDGDLVAGMKANYDALVALAHGMPIPPCP